MFPSSQDSRPIKAQVAWQSIITFPPSSTSYFPGVSRRRARGWGDGAPRASAVRTAARVRATRDGVVDARVSDAWTRVGDADAHVARADACVGGTDTRVGGAHARVGAPRARVIGTSAAVLGAAGAVGRFRTLSGGAWAAARGGHAGFAGGVEYAG